MAMMIMFVAPDGAAARMTDYEAINNLIVSERLYRVSHREKELAACYAPDAQIHTSWQSGGVNSFVGQHPAEFANESFNVNRCGGALIHQNGKRAFVEYPSTTIRSVKVNGIDAVVWKIIDMMSVNEADELQPVVAGTDLQIRPEDASSLRISYRWLAYFRMNAGDTISNDLPSVDRSDDIKRIYSEAEAWFNQSDRK